MKWDVWACARVVSERNNVERMSLPSAHRGPLPRCVQAAHRGGGCVREGHEEGELDECRRFGDLSENCAGGTRSDGGAGGALDE